MDCEQGERKCVAAVFARASGRKLQEFFFYGVFLQVSGEQHGISGEGMVDGRYMDFYASWLSCDCRHEGTCRDTLIEIAIYCLNGTSPACMNAADEP